MKFRCRYFFVVPIVLNVCLILLHMDNKLVDIKNDDSSLLIHRSLQKYSSVSKLNNENIYHTLVDFTYNTPCDCVTENHSQEKEKLILLYNKPKKVTTGWENIVRMKTFKYSHCTFTHDKSKLLTADAVIFVVGLRKERMGLEPPMHRQARNPNQVWIFTSSGSPVDYFNTDYATKPWKNTMNWSYFYRLDSDIPLPYGSLISQSVYSNQNYDSVYRYKTKNALWLIRQCLTASGRRQYVSEMVKHGFNVDIMGICGNNGTTVPAEMLEQIIPTYKFYLGFEASLCDDFITGRFFRNYNYNWIIVVRGGADYRRLLPTETYVNTADFPNISSLVTYLKDLGNDKEQYIKFLRRKSQFRSITYGPESGMCEICNRLNNLSQFKRSYISITDYLSVDQCPRPIDL